MPRFLPNSIVLAASVTSEKEKRFLFELKWALLLFLISMSIAKKVYLKSLFFPDQILGLKFINIHNGPRLLSLIQNSIAEKLFGWDKQIEHRESTIIPWVAKLSKTGKVLWRQYQRKIFNSGITWRDQTDFHTPQRIETEEEVWHVVSFHIILQIGNL